MKKLKAAIITLIIMMTASFAACTPASTLNSQDCAAAVPCHYLAKTHGKGSENTDSSAGDVFGADTGSNISGVKAEDTPSVTCSSAFGVSGNLDEIYVSQLEGYSIGSVTIPDWDGQTPYVYVTETGCVKPTAWDDTPYGSDNTMVMMGAGDLNFGQAFFTVEDYERGLTENWEVYSELDELGRCGVAFANVCFETMPEEKRGEIGHIKPSGWNQAKYPGVVDGNYLWNRCHLIGYQLCGENDNEQNLITGTRYLNIQGMLSYENFVADYVKNTGNHVLYRVTPVYEGNNLTCSGLFIEGASVEDNGEGVRFCVYAYNEQPGVEINHADGTSRLL